MFTRISNQGPGFFVAYAYNTGVGKRSADVVNGDDAELGTWPWVVSLQYTGNVLIRYIKG